MQTHREFPTEPSGLPEATRPALLSWPMVTTLDLRVGPVAKRLGDTVVRMPGYKVRLDPGPTPKVRQGTEVGREARVDPARTPDLLSPVANGYLRLAWYPQSGLASYPWPGRHVCPS